MAHKRSHRIGIIGLGIMGNRMLDRLAAHTDFTAVAGWDPSVGACARVLDSFPTLDILDCAASVCQSALVDCVYIASPPGTPSLPRYLKLLARYEE